MMQPAHPMPRSLRGRGYNATGYYSRPNAWPPTPSSNISEQMGDSSMTRLHTTARMIILASLLLGILAVPGLQAGEWGPYESEGTVLGIMAEQGFILLDHEPIRAPGYLMGKMEMPFSVSDPALINGLKVGDRIHFRVSEEKKSRIVDIRKLP